FLQADPSQPVGQFACFQGRALCLVETWIHVATEIETNHLAGQHVRTRIHLHELNLATAIVQNLAERCVHEIELCSVQSKCDRELQSLRGTRLDKQFV